MSTKRWLTVADFPLGHDKDGWPLCRVCHIRVPTRQNTTCSSPCGRRIRFLCSVSSQAWHVEQRDGGICALCGCDTNKVKRIFRACRGKYGFQQAWAIQRTMRFNVGNNVATWNMDHIVPVSKGGGVRPDMTIDQAMSNLRTLCIPCHKAETKVLTGG